MNKLKLMFLFISFLVFSVNSWAQGGTNRSSEVKKNSISANILGTGSYIGFTYERLLFSKLNVEVGIGLIGIGGGITYYPFKANPKRICPYFGVKYTSHAIVDGAHKTVTYIPFGISYFGKGMFNFGIDIGPAVRHHISPGYMPTLEEQEKYPFTDYGIFGNLKLGFRF
jgi:hypothetical protein